MNYVYNVTTATKKNNINSNKVIKKSLDEIREEKRTLMYLREVSEELFGERRYSPVSSIRHSAR